MTELGLDVVRLLVAIVASESLLTVAPVRADLGAAMTDSDQDVSGKEYEAWCGKKGRENCSIKFTQGVLSVDGSSGITSSQVRKVIADWQWHEYHKHLDGNTCNPVMNTHCQRHFWIYFSDANGVPKKALFRYSHRLTALQFQKDLEAWTGEPLRNIGPAVKIVE